MRPTPAHRLVLLLFLAGLLYLPQAGAQEVPYPVAIFPFEVTDPQLEGYGGKTSDLLFANLAGTEGIRLVERAEMDRILDETELNLSGMVDSRTAAKVGQLTGAKLIITGKIYEIGGELILISRLIGTETSRVTGAKVTGDLDASFTDLLDRLSGKLAKTIRNRAQTLVAKDRSKQDLVDELKEEVGMADRPRLVVDIKDRHVGGRTMQSVTQTELQYYLDALGFSVIDKDAAFDDDGVDRTMVDFMVKGNGASQTMMQHEDVISSKARVEVEAVDVNTGEVVATARAVSVEIGLADRLAAKKALKHAAQKIAHKLIPRLAEGTPASENAGQEPSVAPEGASGGKDQAF